ncbi:MAG: ZIP family metal transporter [Planctomycetota bacterium]
MSSGMLLVVYCLLILLASLAGGWLPLMIRLTHRRMQLAVSLVAGVMLGVGLLHMLPHALMEVPTDAVSTVFLWVLAGFLVMFFLERFFCFHHHDVPRVDAEGAPLGEHSHHHEHEDGSPCMGGESHRLTWTGAAIGLTLHTVIAGIALAASVEAESHGDSLAGLAGLGTFLVIFLHKPFDAMTISTLMTVGAWSAAVRHLVNGLFALMIPLGVVLFQFGLGQVHEGGNVVAYALAFSAGTFLCISMSDLLPELQFHAHDRASLSIALILGLSIAWGIGLFEAGGHGHEHRDQPPGIEADAYEAEHGHEH